MEEEIIDDTQQEIPAEAVAEIQGAAKWMTITAIILIIYSIFALLAGLAELSRAAAGKSLRDILFNLIGMFLYFMLIKTSGKLNEYATSRNDQSLLESLKLMKLYFMISVIIMVFQFFISITVK